MAHRDPDRLAPGPAPPPRAAPPQGAALTAGSRRSPALKTSPRLSKDLGCSCVLTHPIDGGVRDLYRAFGFLDLPFDPGRAMAVRIVDLERSGF